MYTLCSTEKTAQQQHLFEQTFLQMLLASHYDEITICELCSRAGLSRKIFYRLFEKKSDVLYSLIDHTLLESASFLPDESAASGEMHRFFAFWKTQGDLLDAMQKHHNTAMITDRAIRFAMEEEPQFGHLFGVDASKFGLEVIIFYISGIFSLVQAWHLQGYRRSIDEMAKLTMELLTSPAIKNP